MTCGIYMLEFNDGMIYVGASINIERRIKEHNRDKRREMYEKIKENGYFKIEEVTILEEVEDASSLEEREKYWIELKNATNPDIGYNIVTFGSAIGKKGAESPKALLYEQEVQEIREKKKDGLRKKDVYLNYKEKITFSTFENIWLNKSYVDSELEDNLTKSEKISQIAKGSNNNKAKLCEEDVKYIRKLHEEGFSLKEIILLLNKDVKEITIKRVINNITWKHV